jgi:hypothetical protein
MYLKTPSTSNSTCRYSLFTSLLIYRNSGINSEHILTWHWRSHLLHTLRILCHKQFFDEATIKAFLYNGT